MNWWKLPRMISVSEKNFSMNWKEEEAGVFTNRILWYIYKILR